MFSTFSKCSDRNRAVIFCNGCRSGFQTDRSPLIFNDDGAIINDLHTVALTTGSKRNGIFRNNGAVIDDFTFVAAHGVCCPVVSFIECCDVNRALIDQLRVISGTR